jgi:hypothetical protein
MYPQGAGDAITDRNGNQATPEAGHTLNSMFKFFDSLGDQTIILIIF